MKRMIVLLLAAVTVLTAGCAEKEKIEPSPDPAAAVRGWQYFNEKYDDLAEELTDSFAGIRLADGLVYIYFVGSCEKYEKIMSDYESVVQYVEVDYTLHYLEALREKLLEQFPEKKGYSFIVSIKDNCVTAAVPMSNREFEGRLSAFGFKGEPVEITAKPGHAFAA